MKITKKMLNDAVAQNILGKNQASDLYNYLQKRPEQESQFNLSNLIYYFGGMLAIGAMSIFMTYAWEQFGGFGIFWLCLCYSALGLGFAAKFAAKKHTIPAGICATFVIVLTPLAIFGFQLGLGIWTDNTHYQDFHRYIQWQWLYMELGTLIVGMILAWVYRYPFMIMPIAFTLWYMSMDLTEYFMQSIHFDIQLRALVSMYFGLIICLIALWVDLRSRQSSNDYAYWLYLFGVIAFWGGLSCQQSSIELNKFFYCLINIAMMLTGVILMRKVFVTFGAIGCALYIGHLAFDLFKDSVLFPVVLSAIGFIIIYLGTIWHKYEKKLTHKIHSILPIPLQKMLCKYHDNL